MPAKPRLLIAESDRFSAAALADLEASFEVELADLGRRGLLEAVGGCEVLWVRLRNAIDAELLAAAPGLRAIVTPTTGLNHIDLEAAERRGIRVLSLRGEIEFLREIRATAEHTIALLLALLRRLPAAAADVEAGRWDRDRFRGRELFGKTVGVIGYGRLGSIVARYLRAFECEVVANDGKTEHERVEDGVAFLPLPELLARADAVTLHVNLTAENEGMLGEQEFSAMPRGSWFVNTARGELVDEQALLEALRTGHLAGAALDVLRDERAEGMEASELVRFAREHGNLIVTPHIGGATVESMERTERFMAGRLLEAFAEEAVAR